MFRFTDKQDQFDRHQDDDDVLAVQEDAENADDEEERADGQVVGESDSMRSSFRVPLACLDIDHLDRGLRRARDLLVDVLPLDVFAMPSVSTMAPIMATSSTTPAIWKKKM
jgi:hypothetical protein